MKNKKDRLYNIKKILKIIICPRYILFYLDRLGIIRIDDKLYVKAQYELIFDKKLNLKKPESYNEKLQYLKFYEKNEKYSNYVDKYKVKKIVSDLIGEDYVIPTLGIYDNFDDINFSKLPNQFVIKCTHDSGGIVVCNDKTKFDNKKAKKIINKSLKKDYFFESREYPYKDLKPKIMIEEYMEDKRTKELIDYKFYCFNGEPKILDVCSNRYKDGGLKQSYFDMEFNKLKVLEGNSKRDNKVRKPKNFDKMIKIASLLAKNIKHVRIDFYDINGKIYFGEYTFFSSGGYEQFNSEEFNYQLGSYIDIGDDLNENINSR